MTTRYVEILSVQRPFPYGVDESSRTLFSCNFEAMAIAPVESWEREIAWLIEDAGLGLTGYDLTIGPAAPIPNGVPVVVTLIDTGGRAPDETHDGDKYERLSVQVIVRSNDYLAASARAVAIWRLLDGMRSAEVDADDELALLEDGAGTILLEDGSGSLEMEG